VPSTLHTFGCVVVLNQLVVQVEGPKDIWKEQDDPLGSLAGLLRIAGLSEVCGDSSNLDGLTRRLARVLHSANAAIANRTCEDWGGGCHSVDPDK